jgi:hypothetical protein
LLLPPCPYLSPSFGIIHPHAILSIDPPPRYSPPLHTPTVQGISIVNPPFLEGAPPAAPFDNHSTCAENVDTASFYSTSSTTFDIPCKRHDRAHSFPAPLQRFCGDECWRRRLTVRSFGAFGCYIRVVWVGLGPEARWRMRRAIPSCPDSASRKYESGSLKSAKDRREISHRDDSHQSSPPLTDFFFSNVRVWADGCECRVHAVQGQVGCAL